MSRTDTPWNPRSANSRSAASSSRSFAVRAVLFFLRGVTITVCIAA